jgi:hypothetical protein
MLIWKARIEEHKVKFFTSKIKLKVKEKCGVTNKEYTFGTRKIVYEKKRTSTLKLKLKL